MYGWGEESFRDVDFACGVWLVSGSDSLISLSGELGNGYGVKVFEENETIYSGAKIKKKRMANALTMEIFSTAPELLLGRR